MGKRKAIPQSSRFLEISEANSLPKGRIRMKFADIHNHTLAAVDDGAKSEQMMYRMLDAAYADGTRILCLTPHFHPGFFGDNRNASEDSFQKLQSYAAQHCGKVFAAL